MKLYNTLGRELQEFTPISDKAVKLYTCGPTVYSYYHIGNLRNAVFNDTLRRTLEISGYRVKQVMNITDVGHLSSDGDEGEDKLEVGAKNENKSVRDVANFYIEAFKRDMQDLNVLPPNDYDGPDGPYAKATDFIEEQVALVKILLDKEFAYVAEEAIYFDVTKLPSYGELSGQKLSEKEVGAREEVVKDNQKRNPQDFALWFFTVGRFADHSMHWPSPWGDGFPGWHLECSAIIHATLGDPIDIHTGGVDHIGTHHPNEMAQTEAAYGHKLANYWVHNEHMLVDGQKMSKSLGNTYTLEDVKQKGYTPVALRLLYLQSHYRTQSNFSWEELEAARNRLQSLRAVAVLRWQPINTGDEGAPLGPVAEELLENMADDLNSPAALASLSAIESVLQNNLLQQRDVEAFVSFINTLDSLFGLELGQESDISDEQKNQIAERTTARNNNEWQRADELKQSLLDEGIVVRDTAAGPIWYRK